MDQIDKDDKKVYEMLLTALCQYGLASTWGWSRPVADPERAFNKVIAYSMVFSAAPIRLFLRKLIRYADMNLLINTLNPIACPEKQLPRVLHIKPSVSDVFAFTNKKEVFIWDYGKGSRMGPLLTHGKSKGEIQVCENHQLYHYSAGAALWMVDIISECNREYFAIVASDQIVCFSDKEKKQIKTILEAACLQNSDIIFFDLPPEFSATRLRSFLSPNIQPQRNSSLALARDREMLRQYGGSHTFQCVLLKKKYMTNMTLVLQAIIEAALNGFDLDFGVLDVTIMPKLVRPKWLKKHKNNYAQHVYDALCNLADDIEKVFPVCMPIQVFNVNTPEILNQLKSRIANKQ